MKPDRLEELRHILLRSDLDRLEAIGERIETAERRAADVAEVLPDSIAASFRKDSRLIGALRTPLRQCVSESVRESPDEYADALFPIMGPAIRRSITEALRAWTRQINQVIEHSFSPRGIAWRFQAWRAGVPYAQYVLQRTLLYRVEDVYLIHSRSGLLIAHATQGGGPLKDEDAVSAMFTAIQDFVRDSFTRDARQRLTTAELGDLTLWAVHGPATTIVAVIRGVPPVELRGRLESTLERIEATRGTALQAYAGDRASMADLEPELESCLLVSMRESTEERRWSPAFLMSILLVVGLIGWLAHGLWLQSKVARVAAALERTPGIVVTDLERSRNTIVVRGLRDRLAPDPAAVAAEAGWEGEVAATLRPFVSLDDEIVLARARTTLAPPATVALRFADGTLKLTGRANASWVTAAQAAATRVPGVERLDITQLSADDGTQELLRRLIAQLDPPDTVEIALDGSTLVISGEASQAWADAAAVAALPSVVTAIDMSGLAVSERRAMAAIEREINGLAIAFDLGDTEIAPRELGRVVALAERLLEHARYARGLNLTSRITITGHSDDSGTRALNVALERARAEALGAALREAGIDARSMTIRSQLETQVPGPRSATATVSVAAASAARTPD